MAGLRIFFLIIQVLYIAGILAFARFYSHSIPKLEEGTRRARLIAVIGAFIAVVLTLVFGNVMGGVIGVLAGFYVTDHKNRGRGWAFLPLLLGPIGMLVVIFLPKLHDTSTLSLSS